jgi:hypothetical protein
MAGETPKPLKVNRSAPPRSPAFRVTRSQLADVQWRRDHADKLAEAQGRDGGGLAIEDDLGDLGDS